MSTEAIIMALSTLFSPVIAIMISENYLRKKIIEETKRKQVLEDLIANRYKVDTPEFLRAFNSIVFLWGEKDIIKKLVFEFRTASSDKKTPILTEIIYQLCIFERINHLSREDILNVFLKS